MARTDLYERFPHLLEAEMDDLDLPTTDEAVRTELTMVYVNERGNLARRAAENALFERDARAAERDRKRGR